MYSCDTLRSTDDDTTDCIACGEVLPRSETCEYDKHGARVDRQDTEFEALCKPCDEEYSRLPRGDLESLLIEAGAGTTDNTTFLRRYIERCKEQ